MTDELVQRVADIICEQAKVSPFFAFPAARAIIPLIVERCAKAAEDCSFAVDIDEWIAMTKKELSARACHEVAAAIRNLGSEA